MQITDSQTPTSADILRQLQNCKHELEEIAAGNGQDNEKESAKQALYRIREAIAHLQEIKKG